MKREPEMMAAVLHDVVEDGDGWSLNRLAAEGTPSDVVEAVRFLTKRPEEGVDYMAFIMRAGRNAIARMVKLADLEDNMDLGRISNPTERDLKRIDKYRSAHAFLASVLAGPQEPSSRTQAVRGVGRSRVARGRKV